MRIDISLPQFQNSFPSIDIFPFELHTSSYTSLDLNSWNLDFFILLNNLVICKLIFPPCNCNQALKTYMLFVLYRESKKPYLIFQVNMHISMTMETSTSMSSKDTRAMLTQIFYFLFSTTTIVALVEG